MAEAEHRSTSAGRVSAGRLGAGVAPSLRRYTASADTDRRLLEDDVTGSLAHAAMLHHAGILSLEEHEQIARGLAMVHEEVRTGGFALLEDDEDVHMAVERRLLEIIGAAAGKLHTGRSRNDQVATDLRLYSMRACRALMLAACELQAALLGCADEHRDTVMPGYTHLQRAQPVTLAHHLLAYFEMLQRDVSRLDDARRRCDVLPLGSGALAGSTLPLDRDEVARRLGFGAVSENSIDAVSDRDFAVEIAAACALVMVHCSRLCEELVLWSSHEYGFVAFPDAYATGSSLMPQKKNPDIAELARGRTGHAAGALVALLTMLKGLPLAYNRDLQEDKRALFQTIDITLDTLQVLADLVPVLVFDAEVMRQAAADPALLATDVAEYLVLRGVPFREAHHIVGELVRTTLAQRHSLRDLSVDEWRDASPLFSPDVLQVFDPGAAVKRREGRGGPGPRSIAHQMRRARRLIDATRRRLGEMQ